VGLIVVLTIFLGRDDGSDYLTVDRDVTGELSVVKSDGTAIAMDTEDGQVATQVLNANEFTLEPGDTVIGTIVKVGTGDALVAHRVS
jgi:hypothetical protein